MPRLYIVVYNQILIIFVWRYLGKKSPKCYRNTFNHFFSSLTQRQQMVRIMEETGPRLNADNLHPILLLPKKCTTLEMNCDITENAFIDIKVTSKDTENKEVCIYSGLLNIKIVDFYKINVESQDNCSKNVQPSYTYDAAQAHPAYNQSQVWIDPLRSPYVYNHYDNRNSQQFYSVSRETNNNHITVEQHNTYVTTNVYNYNEPTEISLDFDNSKRSKRNDTSLDNCDAQFEPYEQRSATDFNNDKEMRSGDEGKYLIVNSENSALKQLMSTNKQSNSKQRKTILFLGQDSHSGQTVQKITINDPSLECVGNSDVNHEVVVDSSSVAVTNKSQKKYQCDKCEQIFDQISTFRQHMVSTHRRRLSKAIKELEYLCNQCGKRLKTPEKLEEHCLKHGDPDLECDKCHKVFASKFTLRTHQKIHNRKFPCKFCPRSYTTAIELKQHLIKTHFILSCSYCTYTTGSHLEFAEHQIICKYPIFVKSRDTGLTEDNCIELDTLTPPADDATVMMEHLTPARMEQIREADSVLAKVIASKFFLLRTNRTRRERRFNKVCDVCDKNFDRISDLKRHLIEHIIKSTFAKTPIGSDGTLTILCGICKAETFSKIDSYKAHLREHAKLTLYKCTFCNKCFSDSSNFSKHKKIHGSTYFQCDLCHRKFNSKKMIIQHIEYHNMNSPMSCDFCGKLFHFESTLNKHIKCIHTKQTCTRFKCRFCNKNTKTLKEKWDHEWLVHNIRKTIVDCLVCGAKFRKYSELKRHCHESHDMLVMPTKNEFMKEVLTS